MDSTIKKKIREACMTKITDRLKEISTAIEQAQEAIENDTKSSAGDKYETSREMVQQDLNRYQEQLMQAKRDKILLEQLSLEEKQVIESGAIAVTEKMIYFIAISVGKLIVEGELFMVVSSLSPIGQLLMGKQVGDSIHFQGVAQHIVAVY